MRHFENIAYSVIFGDTVYCLKKEQLARIPMLGFQSVTDSVLESIWMDCNWMDFYDFHLVLPQKVVRIFIFR